MAGYLRVNIMVKTTSDEAFYKLQANYPIFNNHITRFTVTRSGLKLFSFVKSNLIDKMSKPILTYV